MELEIRGKVAIIAASSKGLGKASALGLAREGARLTIFSRDGDAIESTAREIRDETGASVLALSADVTNESQLEEVVERTAREYSTVHILVNNAGGPPFGSFEDFPPQAWQKAIELNLLSTINLTRLVVPFMKSQGWGRIVNITSIAVKQPLDGLILSNTARAGVIGFAKSLSNELARFGITVNNVCPGRILTDRILHLAQERARVTGTSVEDVFRHWEEEIPSGRLGTPRELADLVVFLSSERASYITGATIQVDGGAVKSLF
ncbi:MAG: SDR family oxidoreductase [Candidatus Caldarchaeum sp.]